MNGDPEGTPNPLNPMSGNVGSTSSPQPDETEATGTGTLGGEPVNTPTNSTDTSGMSASFSSSSAEPIGTPVEPEDIPVGTATPEAEKVASTPVTSEMPTARQHSRVNHSIVDPMMRPVSRPNPATNINTARQTGHTNDRPQNQNFDTLTMESISIEELQPQLTSDADTNFVAKDSVVEPAGGKKGGKKKAFTIGAIVFLMIAIICGATAIAIVMLKNDDRVTKAIDKLLNGQVSSIIQVKGVINSGTEKICDPNESDVQDNANSNTTVNTTVCGEDSLSTSKIDFDGTFDLKTSLNKVSADVQTTYSDGSQFSFSLDELHNKASDTFIKISLPENLISPSLNTTETVTSNGTTSPSTETSEDATVTETQTVTNCTNAGDATNCVSTTTSTTTNIFSLFRGVFEVINEQWILATDGFEETMQDSALFDNNSTCMLNAFGTLPEYSSDLANRYKSNPFITYSTDKLGISKKKDTLYRLGFDSQKLAAFSNSLSNNGFINELNACANKTATNEQTNAKFVQQLLSNLPTIYVEIDDNNNFTRVYFKTTTTNENDSTSIDADLSITYPTELKITDPENYIPMSEIVQKLSVQTMTSDEEQKGTN